ncbi:MAG: hypothetical protein K1X77_07145 [Bacteroidia bacterium]|jgi:hypothetical protein|nr:hypothetical protein [Bacteroidia bacterium]
MSTREILLIIKQLPFNERLLIIEKALKTLHESTDTQLEKAANSLMTDYQTDKELTAFTALDFEKFYETR